MGGAELALDVKNFDGWVINTLSAKIEATMRITKHPRMRKTFNQHGELTRQAPYMPLNLENSTPSELATDDKDVWVGSLHPLASLIRPAEDGEEINVLVRKNDGSLEVTANCSDATLRMGVHNGEALVRWDHIAYAGERDASSNGLRPSLGLDMQDGDSDLVMADTMAGEDITVDSQQSGLHTWADNLDSLDD